MKRVTSLILITLLMFIFVLPANASQTKTSQVGYKLVEENANGNKIFEVKDEKNNKKSYVVTSNPVIINDASDLSSIPEGLSEEDKVIGKRVYFAFTDDLSEAKKMIEAKPSNSKDGDVESMSRGYFWGHGSYAEDYYYGLFWSKHGTHTYLVSSDTNYIQNVGLTVAGSLAAAVVLVLGAPVWVGIVVGGVVALGAYTFFWQLQNGDGSIDLYTPDEFMNFNDDTLYPNEYLGRAKGGNGWWNNYYWPNYAPIVSFPY